MQKQTENVTIKKPGWLNAKDMSASCGTTPPTFRAWGVEPVGQIGREKFYIVKTVIENRVNAAAENRENRESQPPVFTDDELSLIPDPHERLKARKTEQEIIRLTLQNGVLEGRNLPATVVNEVVVRVLSPAISIFETLPLEITRRYPELDPRVIRDIEKAIAKIRNEAAEVPAHLDEILDDIVAEAEDRIT